MTTTVYRDRCRHFNGTQQKCCAAGVNYRKLAGGPALGWARRLPCLDLGPKLPLIDPVDCPARSLLTQEEHAEHEREVSAAVDAAMAAIAAGMCPTCGGKLEPSKVVGRCRYGACGHRIGQVRGDDEP